MTRLRLLALGAGCAIFGIAIGYVDSLPTWDDTGVTAFTLMGAAAAASLVAPRWAWVWALLVGLWTPLFEMSMGGDFSSLAALLFAFAGAMLGWALRRANRRFRLTP